ncbi:hypothetical protein [Haloarchaeobius amylolyticus]|uniref:hypothetical protein n=1 Tax=Haloarchaeobius amylolyticus TaxID=1198296 RepID=UPI00226FBEAC|nr:hypothetical protein [Haloarchaeobius amylolyticus]
MPTCKHCTAEVETEDLIRHERRGLTLVHCPDCNCLMGQYRDPSYQSPEPVESE